MTVKDLKKHLEQFSDETEVMFSHMDHTDWLYKMDMSEENIYLGDPIGDDSDLPDEMYNEEWDYIGPKVLLFELNVG
jgi:hypothetical protein